MSMGRCHSNQCLRQHNLFFWSLQHLPLFLQDARGQFSLAQGQMQYFGQHLSKPNSRHVYSNENSSIMQTVKQSLVHIIVLQILKYLFIINQRQQEMECVGQKGSTYRPHLTCRMEGSHSALGHWSPPKWVIDLLPVIGCSSISIKKRIVGTKARRKS